MCDSEIISLSSDEELPKSPPRKKIKPTYLGAITITPIKKEKYVKSKSKDDIVVLSDDDSNDVAITKGSEPSNKDKNGVDQTNTNERLGDVITNTLNEVTIIRKNATLDSKSTEKISTNGNIKVVDKVDEICEITESDSEEESSSGKENHSQLENEGKNEDSNSKQSIETSPNEVEDGRMTDESKANQTQSTQSHSDTTKPLLDQFLTICGKRMEGSKFIKLADEKFPILRRFYKKCDDVLNKNSEFKKLLLKCLNKSENASPEKATIAFNEVFTFVKEIADVSSIEVDKETRLKLKKLEHCMKALKKKIKKLEVAEIDFDDEEDSVYLQLDRYNQRLVNVYKKYCEILKKNPHSGRLTHSKVDFADSEFNEINRAISKKFRNNHFPSYYEMERFIKKVVDAHNLQLSENRLKAEAVHCFKKLGDLLQIRRKRELYDSHCSYIQETEDPATKDDNLNSRLKENLKQGLEKIGKVCDEFVIKQEAGEEPVLSEDESDKSDIKDSDEEDKQIDNEVEKNSDDNNKQDDDK